MNPIHANAIVIDGLITSKWERPAFEDMRKGGLTAANCAAQHRAHDVA
jgi:membrane dipeptidase